MTRGPHDPTHREAGLLQEEVSLLDGSARAKHVVYEAGGCRQDQCGECKGRQQLNDREAGLLVARAHD